MNINVLKLHLIETEKALNKVQNNVYSDTAKQDYQASLVSLFNSIKEAIIQAEGDKNPMTRHQATEFLPQQLNFIFKSLEFLDSSTLNLIPYELIKCLEYALSDWLDDADKYIIVTSLINTITFSFDPAQRFGERFFEMITKDHETEFKHKLIQINLPKFLARDYLASVIIYHELGHFIDIKLSIVESTVRDLMEKIESDKSLEPQLLTFFQQLNNQQITTYLREYFCDLFAAQYVGDSCNEYLMYLSINTRQHQNSHPSTEKRVEVINDFLNGDENIIVDIIQNALSQMFNNSKKLEKRYKYLETSDFYNLLPIEINDKEELHGIFPLAWKIWLDDWNRFESFTAIDENKVYSILNNLVEKSIGNYIVKEQWNKEAHLQEH